MRTFIAIKVEPEKLLLQHLVALKQDLYNESIKWIDEKNFHITLKFLGETTEMQVAQIKNLLADFASLQKPISFTLSGFGYFKSRGMPRVLFVDIHDKTDLQQLTEGVETILNPIGFTKDERPFNPHLSLARIKFLKNKKHFYQAIDVNQFTANQFVSINEIIFYQSHLNPDGPVYRELAKYSLSKSG